MAGKWKDLGEILCITDNILNEIFTNNKADETCLQEMLRYYLMRSDLVHNWEKITTALRKLGEEALANKISDVQLSELDSVWLLINAILESIVILAVILHVQHRSVHVHT